MPAALLRIGTQFRGEVWFLLEALSVCLCMVLGNFVLTDTERKGKSQWQTKT